MKKTFELVNKLNEAVVQSSTYTDYIKSLEKIKSSKELADKVNDFKKKHIDYKKRELKNEVSFDEEIYMSSLYFDITRNKDIKEYFENEERLLKFMNAVYAQLNSTFIKVFEI